MWLESLNGCIIWNIIKVFSTLSKHGNVCLPRMLLFWFYALILGFKNGGRSDLDPLLLEVNHSLEESLNFANSWSSCASWHFKDFIWIIGCLNIDSLSPLSLSSNCNTEKPCTLVDYLFFVERTGFVVRYTFHLLSHCESRRKTNHTIRGPSFTSAFFNIVIFHCLTSGKPQLGWP